MNMPEKSHWQIVKMILCYLKKKSTNIGLCFDRKTNSDCRIVRYSDSDFVGDLYRKRSLTGYIFTLLSCDISWKVSLQLIAAFSITEAKYMVVTEAMKELFD